MEGGWRPIYIFWGCQESLTTAVYESLAFRVKIIDILHMHFFNAEGFLMVGIYNARHYDMGHYEQVLFIVCLRLRATRFLNSLVACFLYQTPLDEDTKRSIYHVRRFEVFKLLQVHLMLLARKVAVAKYKSRHVVRQLRGKQVDIFLSHDWPTRIAEYGDVEALLRRKKFLRCAL